MGRDALDDYRTGSYDSERANPQAGTKHSRCANAGSTLDASPSQPAGLIGISIRYFWCSRHAGAARIAVVDEDHPGTNKRIVTDRDSIPNRNAVLDSYAITDYRAGFNK
jgi:hypothetical protein